MLGVGIGRFRRLVPALLEEQAPPTLSAGAVVLEFSEEVFNQMARLIEVFVIRARLAPIRFRGNDHRHRRLLQAVNDPRLGVRALSASNACMCCSSGGKRTCQRGRKRGQA